MSKTNKGKKVVPVKKHSRLLLGRKHTSVPVRPHKRSTPN